MQTVVCPLCNRNIFSETFKVGERFPCPNCAHDLTVEPYTDTPQVKSTLDMVEKMGWANGIWKDGRLMISEEKLLTLGQFVAGAIGLEEWGKQNLEELEQKSREIARVREVLAKNGVRDEFYAFQASLLDIFLHLKRQEAPDRK
jgi:hypothetical protein